MITATMPKRERQKAQRAKKGKAVSSRATLGGARRMRGEGWKLRNINYEIRQNDRPNQQTDGEEATGNATRVALDPPPSPSAADQLSLLQNEEFEGCLIRARERKGRERRVVARAACCMYVCRADK